MTIDEALAASRRAEKERLDEGFLNGVAGIFKNFFPNGLTGSLSSILYGQGGAKLNPSDQNVSKVITDTKTLLSNLQSMMQAYQKTLESQGQQQGGQEAQK